MKERFQGDSNENITLVVSHNSDTAFLYWFLKKKPATEEKKKDFRIEITPTHTDTTTSGNYQNQIDVGYDDTTYFYKKNIVLKENCTIKITNNNGDSSNTISILIKEKQNGINNKHIDTYYQCLPDGSYGITADCITKDKFPTLELSSAFNTLKKKVNTLLRKNIILQ